MRNTIVTVCVLLLSASVWAQQAPEPPPANFSRAPDEAQKLRVVLDPDKAAALGVTARQVAQRISEYTASHKGVSRAEELAGLTVAGKDGQAVRLGDVATITVGEAAPSDAQVVGRVREHVDHTRVTTRLAAQLKYSRVEFRAAPRQAATTPKDVMLSEDAVRGYLHSLETDGPQAGRERGDEYQWFETFVRPEGLVTAHYRGKAYILLCARPGLVMLTCRRGPDAWTLQNASPTMDSMGKPAIVLAFDEAGAAQFRRLTKANIGRPMAVLVDDQAHSVPVIMAETGGPAVISGPMAPAYLDALLKKLVNSTDPAAYLRAASQPATQPAGATEPSAR